MGYSNVEREVLEVAYKTEGEAELKRLKGELADIPVQVKALRQQFDAGTISQREFNSGVQALSDRCRQARADAAALKSAIGGLGTINGRAILELSRGLEDLQYGIAGVLNNIPGLITSLGGSAGLAGVVSIVAVGANLLWKNWDKVASLWGEAHTETEAERMKRLEDATHRTAEETKELNKYKREQAEIEKLLATASESERARTEHINKAVSEVGGEDAVKSLAEAFNEYDKKVNAGLGEEALAMRRASAAADAAAMIARAQTGDTEAQSKISGYMQATTVGKDSAFGKAVANSGAEQRKKEEAEAGAARDKEVEKYAELIEKAEGGSRAMKPDFDADDVRKSLKGAGVSEAFAEDISADVFSAVVKKVKAKVQAHAIDEGTTPDEARQDLLNKAEEKFDKAELRRRIDEAKKTPEQKDREKQAEKDNDADRWINQQVAGGEKDHGRDIDRVAGQAAGESGGIEAQIALEAAKRRAAVQEFNALSPREKRRAEQARDRARRESLNRNVPFLPSTEEAYNAGLAPETDTEFRGRAKGYAVRGLKELDPSGPGGRPVTDEERRAAAGKVVDKAEQDVARKAAELQGRGLDVNAQALAVVNELAAQQQQDSARLAQLEQGWGAARRNVQGQRATNRNRGN